MTWSSIALTCAMGLLPIVTAQLQAVGKQTSQESLSMMLVFGAGYVVSVVTLLLYYRKRLMPRRRALESVLQGRGSGGKLRSRPMIRGVDEVFVEWDPNWISPDWRTTTGLDRHLFR